jgi:hypothetical protein
MNYMGETIFTKEMCERLSITGGTLRKWCIELEENGYEFQKSDGGKRLFSVYDKTALHIVWIRNMVIESANRK